MQTTRRRHLLTLAAAPLTLATSFAHAQSFPERLIRILVPYSAGSSVDAISRMIAQDMSKRLGQQVIVENRVGGQGMIAAYALLNAPSDGYTIMVDTAASAINPSLYKGNYDPATDIAAVAQLTALPFALGVSTGTPFTSAKEFVAAAKAQPGKINVAYTGYSTRLAGELFGIQTGSVLQFIPYKGVPPAIQSVLAHETDAIFLDSANLAPHFAAGKMRGLLVTGEKRNPAIPDVPTAREQGFTDYEISTWFGAFVRKGTPRDIIDKLNEAIRGAMLSPEVSAYLTGRGVAPSRMTSDAFSEFFHSEIKMWRDLIAKAGIKVD